MSNYSHISVLADEVVQYVVPKGVKSFFDGTFGLGGHAKRILEAYKSIKTYLATDLDDENRKNAVENIKHFAQSVEVKAFGQNFSDLGMIMEQEKPARPLGILLDLGLSSPQIDNADRGFSFMAEGELHMGFDEKEENNAKAFIKNAEKEEMQRVFWQFGEEKQAGRLARIICEKREETPIETTKQLADIIKKHTHFKDQKKTMMRIFQAIRMQVNEELYHLEKAINESLRVMQSGDRLGIISYHSLEDRMVKRMFKGFTTPKTAPSEKSLHEIIAPAAAKNLTKKPITPTAKEIEQNPRSRSAKLRIIEKI